MLLRALLLIAIVALAAPPAWANRAAPPTEVAEELAGARLQGEGALTFLTLHVYDARLWVGEGFAADRPESEPLALELQYGRSLYGQKIAERSLEEMQRIPGMDEAQAARWLAWMKGVFPDVKKGDRITGVLRPGEAVRLYFNGRLRGELRDAEFARRFFAIWLGPRTSEPKLRQALLGAAS
jgi:hypothetical protein